MNYIFDIDGTLMNIDHRRHYVEGDKKDWKSFVDNIKHDTPNYPVVNILRILQSLQYSYDNLIFFLTGRHEAQREITIQQIESCGFDKTIHYKGYDYDEILLMRPDGDYRPDAELKSEMFDKIANRYVEFRGPIRELETTLIFDDRQSVVDMWRARGLTCFQVAKGDF